MLGQGPVPFSHGVTLRAGRYLGGEGLYVDVHGGIKQAGIIILWESRVFTSAVMLYPRWSEVDRF